MKFPYEITNSPFFQNLDKCYEVWYWKLNSIDKKIAFWYRFTILKTSAKSLIEVWGILTINSMNGGNKQKHSLRCIKNSYELQNAEIISEKENYTIKIAENSTNFTHTEGNLKDSNGFIKWNLSHTPEDESLSHNFLPYVLWKFGFSKNYAVTVYEDLTFNGEIIYDNQAIPVNNAKGMQGHLCGPKQGHSWAWAHGNIFYDEKTGEQIPCIVDILTACVKLGNFIVSPNISSVFIKYKDRLLQTKSFKDILTTKSKYLPCRWNIEFKQSNYDCKMEISTEEPLIAGVKYEDTDGSNLFCYNSKMATIKLRIIDLNTKIEENLISPNLSAFEWVQRNTWNKGKIYI